MSILGNRVLRTEDPKFPTVGGSYVAAPPHPPRDGALHAAYARTMAAHGTITSIDVDEARRAPGVVAVFTGDDLGDVSVMPLAVPLLNPLHAQPILAKDKVRFVGEPIAAIVAESPAAAADAAELVWAEIDFLPAVLTPEDALSGDTLLFEESGTNAAVELMFGEDDAAFDGCDVVVQHDLDRKSVV